LRKEIEAAFARSGTNGIEQGQGRLWLAIGRVENPRRWFVASCIRVYWYVMHAPYNCSQARKCRANQAPFFGKPIRKAINSP
jgi:hypothetical protein